MSRTLQIKNLVAAFALGAIANFPWEMAHSLLYRGATGWTLGRHLLCCGLAALADGFGIALLYGLGALVFREARWTLRRSLLRLGLVALLGLAGAVLTERLALRLDWWAYSPAMPQIPGTGLGITPLIQFVTMPLVVLFWALPQWWQVQDRRNDHEKPL